MARHPVENFDGGMITPKAGELCAIGASVMEENRGESRPGVSPGLVGRQGEGQDADAAISRPLMALSRFRIQPLYAS